MKKIMISVAAVMMLLALPQAWSVAQSRRTTTTTTSSETKKESASTSTPSRTSATQSARTSSTSAASQTRRSTSTSTTTPSRTTSTASQTPSRTTSSSTAASSHSTSTTTQTPSRSAASSPASTSQSRRTGTSETPARSTSTQTPSRSSSSTTTQTPSRNTSAGSVTTSPSSQTSRSSSSSRRTTANTSVPDQKQSTSTTPSRTTSRTVSGSDNSKVSETKSNDRQAAQERPSSASRSNVRTVSRISSTAAPSGANVRASVSTPTAPKGNQTSRMNEPKGKAAPVMHSPLDFRPGIGGPHGPGMKAPAPIHHVPPFERSFIRWNQPHNHWLSYHHYYGYRLKRLPRRAERIVFRGGVFYCYRGIYYRLFGNVYVVCRPPFESVFEISIFHNSPLVPVRFRYYNTCYYPFAIANSNYLYIQEQNQIIARNNAIIAQQNQLMNEYQMLADLSYSSAGRLGLVQSYAYANDDYYYQDGVFYVLEGNSYRVIVPPAGALVESIPDDYEMVTLADGKEYYKVDETVYKITVADGTPYFEVVGQLYN